MAGRKPGMPKTGGRKKGVRNKIGRDVRDLAQKYTAEAIDTLAAIMRNGESETARALAADKLLDRGHGKPAQVVAGDPARPLNVNVAHQIEREIAELLGGGVNG